MLQQLAIQKVKAKGGIEKEDPNAVRKNFTSPEAKAKIKKRVAEDMGMSGSLFSHLHVVQCFTLLAHLAQSQMVRLSVC